MEVKDTPKNPNFFYRKVIRTKTVTAVNLTPIIPDDWQMVIVKPDLIMSDRICLTLIKLDGEKELAQVRKDNESNQQDTPASR